MSIEKGCIERAKIVYKNMSLIELLKEENLLQRYLYKYDDEHAKILYSILNEMNNKIV